MASKASRVSLRKMRDGRRVFRGPVSGKFSMPGPPASKIDMVSERATKDAAQLSPADQRAVKAADEALKVVDGVLEERKDEAKSFKR